MPLMDSTPYLQDPVEEAVLIAQLKTRVSQLEAALSNITQFSTDDEAVLVARLALEPVHQPSPDGAPAVASEEGGEGR